MLKQFLIVGLGGMFGTMLRFACSQLIKTNNFPLATFLVNVFGSLLIGMIAGYAVRNVDHNINLRLFLATGICGGFTTFSAMSAESLQLLQQQKLTTFFIYILLSIVLGLVACWGGFLFTNR